MLKEVLQDFKVRFVLSFVITFLWSSLLQIHMHSFCNTADFTGHLFPNITSDRRYGTHSFLPCRSPSLHRHSKLQYYSTTGLLTPNILYLPLLLLHVTSILERDEAVATPYGDDTLDSGVRDEYGEDG